MMSGDNSWMKDFEDHKKTLDRSDTSSTVSSFLPPGVTLETVKSSKTQIYEFNKLFNKNNNTEEERETKQESVPPGILGGEPDGPPGMSNSQSDRDAMKNRLSRRSTGGESLCEIPSVPDNHDEASPERTRRTQPLRPSVTKQKAKEMFAFMRNQTKRLFEPLRKSGVFRDQNEEMLEMDINNDISSREFWTTIAAYVGSNALTFFIIWLCAEYVLWV